MVWELLPGFSLETVSEEGLLPVEPCHLILQR